MNYKLNNVSLIYDMDKEAKTAALSNVNLSLKESGMIGIMGPSGSGKSSLLYAMAGLKIPTSGQIVYDGNDMTAMDNTALANLRRQDFGFIFQQHFLINYMTVLENALVPINLNTRQTRKKAMGLLESLGIAKQAGKYPYQLSGGQRQRAAIARALMNDPKVIFGDEPTAALDHESAMEVVDLLTEYTQNTMVVIVTHDRSILKNADTMIQIEDVVITQMYSPDQEERR